MMYKIKVIRETKQPDGTITKQVIVKQLLPEVPQDQERYAWAFLGDYLEIEPLVLTD